MLYNRKCEVQTAAELNAEIRDMLALEDLERGDEICGTLHVYYPNDSVKEASLIGTLEERGVLIKWYKNPLTA